MSIGPLQIVLILLLVLILFGAGKLPRVMGDIGKGIRNLKSGLKEDDEQEKRLRLLEEKSERGELTDAERKQLDEYTKEK